MKAALDWYFNLFSGDNLAAEALVIMLTLFAVLFIYGFFEKLFSRGKRKIQEARIQSDRELAYQQYGPIPQGCTVFEFHKESGAIVSTYTDRYKSSRESDPEKYIQIASFSERHAKNKYLKKIGEG